MEKTKQVELEITPEIAAQELYAVSKTAKVSKAQHDLWEKCFNILDKALKDKEPEKEAEKDGEEKEE